ncbi:MAG TPA: NlpC/P60 family protein [Longimicrobiales bacterium]|nr:NlpC/P60 family protein [Longimicrobiales bacterium]
MSDIEKLIEQVRAQRKLDRRSSVFEIHHRAQSQSIAFFGHTTEDEAMTELVRRARAVTGVHHVLDEVVRLPGSLPGDEKHAVVRSSLAPVYEHPRIPSAQITQIVLGSRVDLLSREGVWWRIRGEDGYIGWVHSGYLAPGSADWAHTWERGELGEPVVSLGAELQDEGDRVLARLPWGARLIRFALDAYQLPDGSRGRLASGEIIPVDRLFDRFPPRGDSVTRTARRWLGAPYLWGGVTVAGVDCSGLTQAVLWMHGIALPRDSDLQGRIGEPVDAGSEFSRVKTGDLLYFAETSERISHVAISLGGSGIIHSSLTNGTVAVNDLLGESEFETRLRDLFVQARRVLPD